MQREESTEEIYTALENVWPEKDRWYNYTHKRIIQFVTSSLQGRLQTSDKYLNAGSGGSTYDVPGICHHVDIAENLIKDFPNHTVASIESLPFPNKIFDATICVGSVINYCDLVRGIHELARTLKPKGYLVLEFERSNTGELWGTKDYGASTTPQKYEYLGHIHTLWLYSERLVVQLLKESGLDVIKTKRFHCLSALANRITGQEENSGKFGRLDLFMSPISYLTAHNAMILCKKRL